MLGGRKGIGSIVPITVQKEATRTLQEINDGKIIVFKGPIIDSTGKRRIPAGKAADSNCIEQMNWVVPGVEGVVTSGKWFSWPFLVLLSVRSLTI